MKQMLGGLLTILGIAGLIYGGYLMAAGEFSSWSIVFAVIGLVMMFAGIKLLSRTKTPEEQNPPRA